MDPFDTPCTSVAGDVIIGINEIKVAKASDLARVVDDLKVGDKVTLKIQRGAENPQVGVVSFWLFMTYHRHRATLCLHRSYLAHICDSRLTACTVFHLVIAATVHELSLHCLGCNAHAALQCFTVCCILCVLLDTRRLVHLHGNLVLRQDKQSESHVNPK